MTIRLLTRYNRHARRSRESRSPFATKTAVTRSDPPGIETLATSATHHAAVHLDRSLLLRLYLPEYSS